MFLDKNIGYFQQLLQDHSQENINLPPSNASLFIPQPYIRIGQIKFKHQLSKKIRRIQ